MTGFMQQGMSLPDRPRHPLPMALLAQILGACASIILALVVSMACVIPLWVIAIGQGVFAAAIAWRLKAPPWWLGIHLIFLPCALLAHYLAWPSWLWFSGFLGLLLVFWRTDISQVPLYLTNHKSREALLSLLPVVPVRVIDIGCGDGRVLRYLARARPDCQFVGFEHAPLTSAWAWILSRKLTNLSIYQGDFWGHGLAAYGLVYAFLSPVPMARLWAKARAEMHPGAFLVSNSFMIPEAEPQQIVMVEDKRHTHLYVYRR